MGKTADGDAMRKGSRRREIDQIRDALRPLVLAEVAKDSGIRPTDFIKRSIGASPLPMTYANET